MAGVCIAVVTSTAACLGGGVHSRNAGNKAGGQCWHWVAYGCSAAPKVSAWISESTVKEHRQVGKQCSQCMVCRCTAARGSILAQVPAICYLVVLLVRRDGGAVLLTTRTIEHAMWQYTRWHHNSSSSSSSCSPLPQYLQSAALMSHT